MLQWHTGPESYVLPKIIILHCDEGSNAKGKNTVTPFDYNDDKCLSMREDTEFLDCFLDLPEIIDGANETLPSSLNFEWLQLKQNQDATIQDWVQRYPQTCVCVCVR